LPYKKRKLSYSPTNSSIDLLADLVRSTDSSENLQTSDMKVSADSSTNVEKSDVVSTPTKKGIGNEPTSANKKSSNFTPWTGKKSKPDNTENATSSSNPSLHLSKNTGEQTPSKKNEGQPKLNKTEKQTPPKKEDKVSSPYKKTEEKMRETKEYQTPKKSAADHSKIADNKTTPSKTNSNTSTSPPRKASASPPNKNVQPEVKNIPSPVKKRPSAPTTEDKTPKKQLEADKNEEKPESLSTPPSSSKKGNQKNVPDNNASPPPSKTKEKKHVNNEPSTPPLSDLQNEEQDKVLPSAGSSTVDSNEIHWTTSSSVDLEALAAKLDEHAKEFADMNASKAIKANTNSTATKTTKTTATTTTSTTANTSKTSLQQKIIILGGGLKSQMLVTIETVVPQLGGKMTQEFDGKVTHLVGISDDSGCFQRTLKYCSAVLNGIWIMSFDWVLASLAAKNWVDETPFEIKGDNHCFGAPQKARKTLSQPGAQRLFEELSFHFSGTFVSPSPSRENLEQLVKIGKAQVLPSLPAFPTSAEQFLKTSTQVIVVCDPQNMTPEMAANVQQRCSLLPVSYHWILDSISAYELLPIERYRVLPQVDQSHFLATQQSLEF